MIHLKTFENLDDKIFIDSEHIEHDRKHRNVDDAYCGYEKALKIFSYNNVKVEQAKGDVSGDDFKGFFCEIEILLSNGLFITWQHEATGFGTMEVKTKNDTDILIDEFNLTEIQNGYANVLISKIKNVIDFNF